MRRPPRCGERAPESGRGTKGHRPVRGDGGGGARRPGRALDAQPRLHVGRRASGRPSGGVEDPPFYVRLRHRRRFVRGRRAAARPRHRGPRGRQRDGGLRRRRRSRHHGFVVGAAGSGSLPPQQRERHIRGRDSGSGAGGHRRRPEPVVRRLRQRRLRRRSAAPGGVDRGRGPQLPAPEQRRRNVHGRDRDGRAAARRAHPDRRLGRLRQRRRRRSLSRQRVAVGLDLPVRALRQQGGRDVHRRRRAGRRPGDRGRQRARPGAMWTTTGGWTSSCPALETPTCCSATRARHPTVAGRSATSRPPPGSRSRATASRRGSSTTTTTGGSTSS